MVVRGLGRWRYSVAGQALPVVSRRFADELLVRVVACGTGEARVAVAPATAAFETIGLKAHSLDPGGSHFHYIVHCAMAGSTEID
jgi:hypothetical protein